MKTTLTALTLAAALLMPVSAWATDDDYSLELHPAACKAATARIVEATGGANPREVLDKTMFTTPGRDPLNFEINCGSSPEAISAKIFIGFRENSAAGILLAARAAHGLTGENIGAASGAVRSCLSIAETTREDEDAPPHIDLQQTHFECWSVQTDDGFSESITVTAR